MQKKKLGYPVDRVRPGNALCVSMESRYAQPTFSFSVHSKLSEEDDFVYKKTFSFKHPSPIVNVIPGDFTHDGKLDLLVMSQNEIPSQLDISLYRGSPGGEFGMRVFLI
jgi:hypothetical protein